MDYRRAVQSVARMENRKAEHLVAGKECRKVAGKECRKVAGMECRRAEHSVDLKVATTVS
jgi:hypothetical protein